MNTRSILGIAIIAGFVAALAVTDAQAQKGKGASNGNSSNAGLVKGGGSVSLPKTIPTWSVRDRRGQAPKVVNPPPKVVPPPRCIITPTHCRPYDPTKSPDGKRRPQVRDHRK